MRNVNNYKGFEAGIIVERYSLTMRNVNIDCLNHP